jgi:hypothetical protein
MTREEQSDKFGRLIDKLDNNTHTLQIPMRPEIHVGALKQSLPGIVKELKSVYVEIFGDNPWD